MVSDKYTEKQYQTTIQALESIVQNGSAKCGDEFFNSMVVELASALDAEYSFVGTLTGDKKNCVRTLALCVEGKIVDNFEYELEATPCADVIGNTVCSFSKDVTKLYPDDQLLIDMSVEGYVGVPLFDSHGKPLGIVVALYKKNIPNQGLAKMILQLFASRISNEIERQIIDDNLRNSEAKYHNVVNDMLDYLNIFTVDGKMTLVNQSLAHLVKMKKEDLIGLSFYDFLSEETRGWLKGKLNELTPKQPIFTHEQVTVLQDGSERVIQWINRAMFNKEGVATHYQSVGRDFTEKRNSEKYQEDLRERLHHSEKMLAIGQLAGGVAHDFNNQLSGIVGFSDLLREKHCDDAGSVKFIDNILTAAKRSSDLTSQLLAFARKGKFLSKSVDVHKLIGEVVTMLQHSIDKQIAIKQILSAPKPFIVGDPSQLQNAIMNLALNARDAMPGGGEIIISTDLCELDEEYCAKQSSDFKAGKYIQISIIDNGSGIEEEVIKRIFEPFFTTKEPGKGTGMGLAAVYGTLKNHSGSIDVTSKLGHGTTVKLYLPQNDNESELSKREEQEGESKKGTARILLVDDEEMVLEVTLLQLEQLGFEVKTCTDGIEAVEYYSNNWQDIDLVILDMVMPNMSGKHAFQQMKEKNPNVIAILSSGYSIDGEAQSILDNGVKTFIQKPYRLSQLSQKISQVLPGK